MKRLLIIMISAFMLTLTGSVGASAQSRNTVTKPVAVAPDWTCDISFAYGTRKQSVMNRFENSGRYVTHPISYSEQNPYVLGDINYKGFLFVDKISDHHWLVIFAEAYGPFRNNPSFDLSSESICVGYAPVRIVSCLGNYRFEDPRVIPFNSSTMVIDETRWTYPAITEKVTVGLSGISLKK